jgi:tetratricopeptide (TPR) repeat protein
VLIVRNEEGRVGRALSSVREAADSWFVVDTGSTDGTVEEIRSVTNGWPGRLVSRPWVSFGANRSELVRLARDAGDADWLLTIDADHVIQGAPLIPGLVADADVRRVDALLIRFTSDPVVWTTRLIRVGLPWRYVGATREYLTCDTSFTQEKVEGPQIRDHADGSSRENKYRRDVELLREELAAAPDNARSWFYLGESYRGLAQHELAATCYTNCVVKTKAPEEKYIALTLSGEMLIAHGDTDGGLARLLLANQERPQRREALLIACQVLNQLRRPAEVIALLAGKITWPIPADDLSAILPAAYGPAMARELVAAKAAMRAFGR